MKVVYLSPEIDLSSLDLATVEAKNQNKYGVMHSFKDKMELVTDEHITDYHVYTSTENKDKLFLCVKSPQLSGALRFITDSLTKSRGCQFKPEKEFFYIKMTAEQAASIPKNQQLNISVSVYGVFYQNSTKTSFLQVELTGFKSYPLVTFN
jgi:hypothetical protein